MNDQSQQDSNQSQQSSGQSQFSGHQQSRQDDGQIPDEHSNNLSSKVKKEEIISDEDFESDMSESHEENYAYDPADASQGSAQQSLASQEYEKLKVELEDAKKKLQDMVLVSQRALADLQNFKRRSEEEKASFVVYANSALFLALLPVIDNVHRALGHNSKDQEWAKGVEHTLRQFTQILEQQGLKIISTAGEKFNPKFHEALLQGPGEQDLILEELEKGYMLGDRVLKPARVKVGNGEES